MRKSIILEEFTSDGQVCANCPECHEELKNSDLEMFFACPYCGCALEDDEDLNRFVMSPIISNWLYKSLNVELKR